MERKTEQESNYERAIRQAKEQGLTYGEMEKLLEEMNKRLRGLDTLREDIKIIDKLAGDKLNG